VSTTPLRLAPAAATSSSPLAERSRTTTGSLNPGHTTPTAAAQTQMQGSALHARATASHSLPHALLSPHFATCKSHNTPLQQLNHPFQLSTPFETYETTKPQLYAAEAPKAPKIQTLLLLRLSSQPYLPAPAGPTPPAPQACPQHSLQPGGPRSCSLLLCGMHATAPWSAC